jgi:GlcNAc-PI de-N-acetylase
MTRLFLLAHQDDEIGVMNAIREQVRRGGRPACVFLTNGAFAGVTAERRNAESTRVLRALGVADADMHFLGPRLGIGDGCLVERLDDAYSALREIASAYGDVESVVVHAWEGGHHDHDAAHLVGRALARCLGVSEASRQFALYRAGPGGQGMQFAALDPAAATVDTARLGLGQGLRQLLLLRHYRSQLRVMAQLGPRAAKRWLVDRVEALQAFPPAERLAERPAEHLLYERWRLYTYAQFREHADRFIEAHGLGEPSSLPRSFQRGASQAPGLVA